MKRRLPSLGLLLLCAGAMPVALMTTPAAAQSLRPGAVFVQGGSGSDEVRAVSVGLLWPWAWRADALGGAFTGQTELLLGQWRAQAAGGGNANFVQLGLVPLLRYRPSGGQSPWFVEGGIGVSLSDQRFVSSTKTFSTRLNFSDNLAVGRSFGFNGEHELSLRWQHTSNAGLRNPNPGMDLALVRYGTKF